MFLQRQLRNVQYKMEMNERTFKISVLVPIYGVETYIERCARSLFEQSISADIEYIFINDCTKDGSIEVLQKVISEFPELSIRIIEHEKNQGLAQARKTAFCNAHGKYWYCCDSDDWVELDMLENLYKTAENEDADIVSCGFLMETRTQSQEVCYDYEEDSMENILSPKYFGWIYGAIWNKLIRAELYLLNHIEPWNGINMWEDSCLTLRLRILSRKTIICPRCYYHYNVANNGSITYSFKLNKVLEMIEAAKKIEHFLIQQGLESKGSDLIDYLKITSKESLLSHPNYQNLRLFKASFPEVNSRLVKYEPWGNVLKIRGAFTAYSPLWLSWLMLNFIKMVVGTFRKN